MVKDATSQKTWLIAPVNFWVSLLVSTTVSNCLPLPTIAAETKNAIASVPQQASSVEIPATSSITSVAELTANEVKDSVPQASTVENSQETPTANTVTSVAELASDRKDINSVQDTQAIPPPIILGENPGESSTDVPMLEEMPSVSDLSSGDGEIESDDPMSQITNVTQLRDVSPGDWAFEALRSLVERYGCIAGYPDGTYRGNRATSRYEFAAGLNACLQQIERIIKTGGEGVVTRQDLETLQRLTEEFQTELASLGTRVDLLEGRVAFLEEHQFSTTTKLNGLVWFNLTGATAGDNVKVETSNINTLLELRPAGRNSITNQPIVQNAKDPEISFSNLIWLTLETSFTGKDSLVTQLAAGNGISPANAYASAGLFNTFGTPFFDQTAGPELTGSRNDVILRELFYRFPIGNKFQVVFGPRINWYRYFDNNAFTFILNGANTFNSNSSTLLNTIDRGSGLVLLWDISQKLKLHLGYLGENDEFLPGQFGFNSSSNPSKGLFNATYTATAELTFSPTDKINLRLLYNYSSIDPTVPILDENGNQTGLGVGGAVGEPIYGVADDGFGGSIDNAIAHTFGVNFDWLITSGFGIFGRYTYTTTNIDPITPSRPNGHINAQAFQVGLGFPDLGKTGALATLSFMVPFDVLRGGKFLAAGGGDGGTQYELEASYYYPISRNIALVPAFYLIGNPNNFDDNPTIYVGNLRFQFAF